MTTPERVDVRLPRRRLPIGVRTVTHILRAVVGA